MYYVNASQDSYVYKHIKNGLENITISGWRNNIPINSPWECVQFQHLWRPGSRSIALS